MVTHTREELQKKTNGELRRLARECGLRGYPGTVAPRTVAMDLILGEIDAQEALRRIIERRADDPKMLEWLARNGENTANGDSTKAKAPKATPKATTKGGADKPDKSEKGATKKIDDPRKHPHWRTLEEAAKAMGIPLNEALDRIAKLESELEKATRVPEYNDPDGWGVDPNYIPTPAAMKAKRLIEQGKPVYLVGPAGSGKSMALRWVCKELKRKMIFVSMHEDQQADTLEGYSWLKAEGGATYMEWCEGIIQRALEDGAVLVVDEFDRAPSSIQHLLNDVAQSGSYTLKEGPDAGKRIVAKPGFLLVATGNTVNGSTGQYSSNSIDKSTLSRFRVLYVDFDEEAEKRILQRMELDAATAARIHDAVRRARELWRQGDLPVVLGTRHLIHIAQDVRDGFSFAESWEMNASMMQGDPTDPFFAECQKLAS